MDRHSPRPNQDEQHPIDCGLFDPRETHEIRRYKFGNNSEILFPTSGDSNHNPLYALAVIEVEFKMKWVLFRIS